MEKREDSESNIKNVKEDIAAEVEDTFKNWKRLLYTN